MNNSKYSALFIVILVDLFVFAQFAYAQNWALTIAPNNPWTSIASSADGSKLVAVSIDDGIFTSTNSGTTWLEVSNYTSGMWVPSTRGISWYSVASSADGVKLAAASFDGYGISTSTNSGMSWQYTSAPSYQWYSVASSSDGTKLTAVSYHSYKVYASTNSGANWTQLINFPGYTSPGENLRSVACSPDGTKLATASAIYLGSGRICISTNSGQAWQVATNAPADNWDSVALSADGTKLAAAPQNDSIYISTNSGTTWSATDTPNEVWMSVSLSADGSKLIGGSLDVIYTSTDFGANWTSNSLPSGYWNSVASSADGNKLAAVDDNGGGSGIWTSQSTPTPYLNITPTNGGLVLSWIVPSTNFVMQQNFNLTTTNWTLVTNMSVLNLTNLQYQAVLSPTNNSFYRLKTP